ncbi:IS5 family transposase [Streptomyces canus]
MSDARWALIEPVFNAWRARRTGPGTAARVHDLREIVNAILYVNRTGIPWEYLPHDFPPYKTVYDYFAKWEADGTTQQVHDLLRDKTRRFHGRRAEPTAAVVDAQSVKTSANVAETSQGIDAGKKIKGRKRHLITDTLGLVLAVLVTAANVHDTTGGKLLLDDLAAHIPACPRSGPTAVTRTASSTTAPVWASMSRWFSGRVRRGSSRCRNGG